jgi:hypothetical protein
MGFTAILARALRVRFCTHLGPSTSCGSELVEVDPLPEVSSLTAQEAPDEEVAFTVKQNKNGTWVLE